MTSEYEKGGWMTHISQILNTPLTKDGVLEDWPQTRGDLRDKFWPPWPRLRICCPRPHPCHLLLYTRAKCRWAIWHFRRRMHV